MSKETFPFSTIPMFPFDSTKPVQPGTQQEKLPSISEKFPIFSNPKPLPVLNSLPPPIGNGQSSAGQVSLPPPSMMMQNPSTIQNASLPSALSTGFPSITPLNQSISAHSGLTGLSHPSMAHQLPQSLQQQQQSNQAQPPPQIPTPQQPPPPSQSQQSQNYMPNSASMHPSSYPDLRAAKNNKTLTKKKLDGTKKSDQAPAPSARPKANNQPPPPSGGNMSKKLAGVNQGNIGNGNINGSSTLMPKKSMNQKTSLKKNPLSPSSNIQNIISDRFDGSLMANNFVPQQPMEDQEMEQEEPEIEEILESSADEIEEEKPAGKISNRGYKLPETPEDIEAKTTRTNLEKLYYSLSRPHLSDDEEIDEEEPSPFPEKMEEIRRDQHLVSVLQNKKLEEVFSATMDFIEVENECRKFLINFATLIQRDHKDKDKEKEKEREKEFKNDFKFIEDLPPSLIKNLREIVQFKIARSNEIISNLIEARGKMHQVLAQRDRMRKVIRKGSKRHRQNHNAFNQYQKQRA